MLWDLKNISDIVDTLHLSYFRGHMTSMWLDFACSIGGRKREGGSERQSEEEDEKTERG